MNETSIAAPVASTPWFHRPLLVIAALLGATAVGIGAFAAHGLPKRLEAQGLEPEVVQKKLDQCELAVRYQMFHALAILAMALSPIATRSALIPLSAFAMLLGVVFFSGGLYSIVFANQIIHWAIVPIGGSILILGWSVLLFGALTQSAKPA
jgi:uncharacterized membrane protein YgdD (TMEM256/DUF423 family)